MSQQPPVELTVRFFPLPPERVESWKRAQRRLLEMIFEYEAQKAKETQCPSSIPALQQP